MIFDNFLYEILSLLEQNAKWENVVFMGCFNIPNWVKGSLTNDETVINKFENFRAEDKYSMFYVSGNELVECKRLLKHYNYQTRQNDEYNYL